MYFKSGKSKDYSLLSFIKKVQNSYKKIEREIKESCKKYPLKIAFFVSLSSMFPAKPLLKKLLQDKSLSVSIVVIPDFRFGVEKAKINQDKCVQELQEYKDILYVVPIDPNKDKINLKLLADIIFFPFSYDISHPKYNLLNIIKQEILPAIINYGFFRSLFDRNQLISSPKYSLFWKIFTETKYNHIEYKKYSIIRGKNTFLSGYCKMDSFYPQKHCQNQKKTIIIAPHHSIKGGYNDFLALSNFARYAEFFLDLPNRYPQIQFIFRPHPALFSVLESEHFWGKAKSEKYLREMALKKNVKISQTGDYFEEFAKSDGIIQDCGSYLVEYFYTLKPQCYLLKSTEDINEKFSPLGKECLKRCYLAYNEQEIINFVENVIIKEQDDKRKERESFAQKKIMINHGIVSDTIAGYLKKIFRIKA